jgi:hypothetical protein
MRSPECQFKQEPRSEPRKTNINIYKALQGLIPVGNNRSSLSVSSAFAYSDVFSRRFV